MDPRSPHDGRARHCSAARVPRRAESACGTGLRVHPHGPARRVHGGAGTRDVDHPSSTSGRRAGRARATGHVATGGQGRHRRRRRSRALGRGRRGGRRGRGARRARVRLPASRQRGVPSDPPAVERHAGAGRGHGPRHAVGVRTGAARRGTRVHGLPVHAGPGAAAHDRVAPPVAGPVPTRSRVRRAVGRRGRPESVTRGAVADGQGARRRTRGTGRGRARRPAGARPRSTNSRRPPWRGTAARRWTRWPPRTRWSARCHRVR